MTFTDALQRRGLRFRVTSGQPAKIHLCCPFCATRGKAEDKQFRLCVHAAEGWGRCMHCDWKRRSGAPNAVLKALGSSDSVEGVDRALAVPEEPVHLPEDFQRLGVMTVYDELDKQAFDYLTKQRGILRKQIIRRKIGVSYVGRYAYRIVFPIYANGLLRAINARDFTGNQKPKYLTNAGPKYLFAFDAKAATVVLSEGVIKALRIEQVFKGCSASLLGHSLTDQQLKQLQESTAERIVLFPDLDNVGRKGFINIADRLMEWGRCTVQIIWPLDAPADELSLAKLKEHLQRARTYDWGVRQKILSDTPFTSGAA